MKSNKLLGISKLELKYILQKKGYLDQGNF